MQLQYLRICVCFFSKLADLCMHVLNVTLYVCVWVYVYRWKKLGQAMHVLNVTLYVCGCMSTGGRSWGR